MTISDISFQGQVSLINLSSSLCGVLMLLSTGMKRNIHLPSSFKNKNKDIQVVRSIAQKCIRAHIVTFQLCYTMFNYVWDKYKTGR